MRSSPNAGSVSSVRLWAAILFAGLTSLACVTANASIVVADDFQRPDGPVGNGWLLPPSQTSSGSGYYGGINRDGQYQIINGKVTAVGTFGPQYFNSSNAVMYRDLPGMDTTAPVRISMKFTGQYGNMFWTNGTSNGPNVQARIKLFGSADAVSVSDGLSVDIQPQTGGPVTTGVYLLGNNMGFGGITLPATGGNTVDLTIDPSAGTVSGTVDGYPVSLTFNPAVVINRTNRIAIMTLLSANGETQYPTVDDVRIEYLTSISANAGSDQSANELAGVTLNGSASQGDSLSYSWVQVAGPTVSLTGANTVMPTFTAPLLPGGFGSQMLSFQLTVTDGTRSGSAVTNVAVANVNHPPVADAGSDVSVYEGALVTLAGTNSFDSDSDPINYSWTQLSGPLVQLSSTSAASVSFATPIIGGAQNNYVDLIFALTVSDGALSHAAPVKVRVERVNHPPLAVAGSNVTVRPGVTVQLDGNGSSDPDNDAVQFSWAQIGGSTVSLTGASGATPTFTSPPVTSPTQLTFRLLVSDGLASSTPSNVVVTVTNNTPVCSAATASPSELWPPNHALIPVRIVGVSDPDNDRLALTITGVQQDEPTNGTGDGDTSPDAMIQGSNLLLRAERAGTGNGRVYIVSFTASDSVGGTCTGTVQVAVPKSKSLSGSAVDSGVRYNALMP